MNRLSYAVPLIASLAFAGCTGDDTSPADTEAGSDTGTAGGGPAGDPATGPGDDSDTTAGNPDGTADEEGDPCDGVECPDGEECVAGTCFPVMGTTAGPMCDEFGGGAWADCVDGEACGGVGGGCLGTAVDGEGSCIFDCETICDCPPAPDTGTAGIACADIAGPMGPDGVPDCYIDCSGGETCPDGMICLGDFCAHTNSIPQDPVGPYEGCNNPDFPCEKGVTCVSAPEDSTCAGPCMSVDDCPEPPEGGTVACNPITGGDDPPDLCHLTCMTDGDCPDTWTCFMGFVCVQPIPQPPAAGYGSCDPADNCLPTEECYEVMGEGGGTGGSTGGSSSGGGSSSSGGSGSTGGSSSGSGGETGGSTGGGELIEAYNVCSQPDCADETECPLAPATGDAAPACGDIGGGDDTCYLDCSGGETCPDSMVCVDDLYCAFDSNDSCAIAIGDPSFESGSPNDSWTEASILFNDSIVCSVDTCGGGAAASGEFFVWFGGAADSDDASVEQEVVIPANATDLTFQLSIPVITSVNPELDNVRLLIDGNEEFAADGDDAAMFLGYQDVVVDVSAYADDASHTIRIESHIEGDEQTSIFVDDVVLVCG